MFSDSKKEFVNCIAYSGLLRNKMILMGNQTGEHFPYRKMFPCSNFQLSFLGFLGFGATTEIII